MTDAINSKAAQTLKNYLARDVKILDLYVRGKWLVAELSSNITFSILNK